MGVLTRADLKQRSLSSQIRYMESGCLTACIFLTAVGNPLIWSWACSEILFWNDNNEREAEVDPRLATVLEILLTAPEAAPSADELAAAVGMSRSWLLHRFKEDVGVPIRRFRNWFRLKAAVLLLKEGDSLAQAAVGAFFYDQFHFANAFREILGIQPGLVFSREGGIRWNIDNEQLTKRLLDAGT